LSGVAFLIVTGGGRVRARGYEASTESSICFMWLISRVLFGVMFASSRFIRLIRHDDFVTVPSGPWFIWSVSRLDSGVMTVMPSWSWFIRQTTRSIQTITSQRTSCRAGQCSDITSSYVDVVASPYTPDDIGIFANISRVWR